MLHRTLFDQKVYVIVLFSCLVFVLSFHHEVLYCIFCQAGPPRGVDCLAPRWGNSITCLLTGYTSHYQVGSRSEVLQPFDYSTGTFLRPEVHRM